MPGDGAMVFAVADKSRVYLGEWLPWIHRTNNIQDSERTARLFYSDFILRKNLHFVIMAQGELIGCCCFNELNWDIPSAAIGYWCAEDVQGRGYISEAVAALTIYGFRLMGLKKINIVCDDKNTRSAKVPERLDYKLETVSKASIYKPGSDEVRFGRIYVRFDAYDLENWKVGW
jgi:RimJ/RimL family protein N-acetyltransferase